MIFFRTLWARLHPPPPTPLGGTHEVERRPPIHRFTNGAWEITRIGKSVWLRYHASNFLGNSLTLKDLTDLYDILLFHHDYVLDPNL